MYNESRHRYIHNTFSIVTVELRPRLVRFYINKLAMTLLSTAEMMTMKRSHAIIKLVTKILSEIAIDALYGSR